MKTRTFYFFILLLPCIMFGQNGHGPDVVIPVRDGDADFAELHYFDGRTYHCEQWVDNYMWYYQSNYSKEFDLVPPSIRYSQLKKIANDEQAALFHFELLNPRSFVHGTPDYVVEDFLINYDSLRNHQPDYYDEYLEERLLPFSGIVMPNKLRDKEMINVTIDVTHPIYDIIENIELRDETHTVIGILNSRNPVFPTYIKTLKDLFITIHLTNGYEYNFYLKDEDCVLRPPVEEVDYVGPELPPPPPVTDPPIEPETDDDCNLKPTYYNHPVTGEPYTATIFHSTPDKIIGYRTVSKVVSYTTTLPPELVFETTTIPIYNPYTTDLNSGVYGEYGLIKTAVYKNPFHETVQNPVIITDGIDFLSNRGFDKMLKKFGGNQTIQTLWDGGYDVIFADFAGGADFIQRNGYALIELLRSLKQDQGIDEIPAIIGPSMGGQVVRYALLYWENHLTGLYGPHNVKVFLSADSPWSGANASPAVMGFADKLIENSRIAEEIHFSANAPAARQLLLHHTYNKVFQIQSRPILYTANQHKFKDEFDAEIADLGSFPIGIEKLISIADGSSSGYSDNAAPNNNLFNIYMKTNNNSYYGQCSTKVNARAIGGFGTKLLKTQTVNTTIVNIVCDLINEGLPPDIIVDSNPNYFDSCPGSPFELSNYFKAFKPGDKVIDKKGIRLLLDQVELDAPFCFIPTFSALGLDASQAFSDLAAQATKSQEGYIVPGSPFDYVWFDDTDSPHNDFTQPGSVEFLLTHLEYQPILESSCLIEDPEPIILDYQNQYYEVSCTNSNVVSINSISSNDCNLYIYPDGNGIGIEPTNYSQNCTSDVEVCFNVEGCSTEICQTIHVEIDGFGIPKSTFTNQSLNHVNVFADKNLVRSELNLSPNPTSGIITVRNYEPYGVNTFLICSTDGRIVRKINASSTIDISDLDAGLYIIKALNAESTVSIDKIILVK